MSGAYQIQVGLQNWSALERAQREYGGVILEIGALRVWTNGPVMPLGKRGCILGHLFDRAAQSRRVAELQGASLARVMRTNGQSLVTEFWGGYVLVWIGDDDGISIMRCPSGTLPCYWSSSPTGLLVSDSVADLAAQGESAVDFLELARSLAGADLASRATCLEGVAELVAGECLVYHPDRVSLESWWSPWCHVAKASFRAFEEAAQELRMRVLDATNAWAGSYDNVLLGLSGGLDSSIVATGCAASSADVDCLNLIGPDFDGDERRYARAVADGLGLDLHEIEYDLATIDVQRAPAPYHARPNAPYFRQAIEAVHHGLQSSRIIDAHFSGNGGDGIFCSMRSTLPLIDRYLANGLGWSLVETVQDLSALTGSSALEIVSSAWKKMHKCAGRHIPHISVAGFTREATETMLAPAPDHPWLVAPKGGLPGPTTHVAFLARSHRGLELYPRRAAPPHVAPLLSQPVVEFCLSLPSWLAVKDGKDRALARAAFADILPPAILARRHKGGPGGFSRTIYWTHKAKIHEMLRGGRLAQAGIFDARYLDQPLDPGWRQGANIQRILTFAAAEAWVDFWSSRPA